MTLLLRLPLTFRRVRSSRRAVVSSTPLTLSVMFGQDALRLVQAVWCAKAKGGFHNGWWT